MHKIRVLQGSISGVQRHYGRAVFLGVTFDIGNPPELVTIGEAALDLLEGEYLAVAVRPGIFSDRGSIALAYRRLGQKGDPEPSDGYSGFICLLTAVLILYATLSNLDLVAHPIAPVVGVVLATLLTLMALRRRKLARNAAQLLSGASLDQAPVPKAPKFGFATDFATRPKPRDAARWVVLSFGVLVMLVLSAPLVIFGPTARTQDLDVLWALAGLGLCLLGIASLVFVIPTRQSQIRWDDSAQGRRKRAAAAGVIGLLTVCGGIYSGFNGPYRATYTPVADGGGGLSALATWFWNVLSDTLGPWGPGVVVTLAGLAICLASIKYLRRV
jgi:hypothetical protein